MGEVGLIKSIKYTDQDIERWIKKGVSIAVESTLVWIALLYVLPFFLQRF